MRPQIDVLMLTVKRGAGLPRAGRADSGGAGPESGVPSFRRPASPGAEEPRHRRRGSSVVSKAKSASSDGLSGSSVVEESVQSASGFVTISKFKA